MINNKLIIPIFILLLTLLCGCSGINPHIMAGQGGSAAVLSLESIRPWKALVAQASPGQALTGILTMDYPYDGAVFPPEIASPTFKWTDSSTDTKKWLVVIRLKNTGKTVYVIANRPLWTPDRATWEAIKAGSVNGRAKVSVYGIRTVPKRALISAGSIHFTTSKDPVDASIFYRQVPLPFETGTGFIRKMKWRLGNIASYHKPPVVMQNLTTCASCHMFSKDSRLISMEMNYKKDSGAHIIAPVEKIIELSSDDFITWKDFPKPDILPKTRGVFAKLSPTGNRMVGTVNEIAFFALTNEPAFSQLFFPTYGVLAWYDVGTRQFHRLPGADNKQFVQTDPAWSWDEKYIVFARARTRNDYHDDITHIRIRKENADIQTLNSRYPIRFDLYRIPFSQGEGGVAEPLEGASGNGMSNYFARYSPDGQWIVFTRSKSGIMLQPDSELFMIPAAGGKARRMNCNRDRFNSWHSFCANGRWMLFSSKTNSKFTEIFLTHIDENGMDSPPVCLSRLNHNGYAANVPEFVSLPPGALEKIVLTDK